ncbi:MAG: hypothetical protein ABIQ12_11095, partial [Opitutaceae bacterium]
HELLIAPFSNYTRREPPGWYARLYFESMLRVASVWKKELENEDHYLAVWLFYPRLSKSQVVAAVGGDSIEYYRNRFRLRSSEPRFPDFVAKHRFGQNWKAYWDYEKYYKDGDELTDKRVESLRSRHAIEEKDGADLVYQLPLGTVWISEESALNKVQSHIGQTISHVRPQPVQTPHRRPRRAPDLTTIIRNPTLAP